MKFSTRTPKIDIDINFQGYKKEGNDSCRNESCRRFERPICCKICCKTSGAKCQVGGEMFFIRNILKPDRAPCFLRF